MNRPPVVLEDKDCDESEQQAKRRDQLRKRIKAIVCVMDPMNWRRELQIMCDILRSDGIPGNLVDEQEVPLFLSCPDFEYSGEFHVPRFGAGTFGLWYVCVSVVQLLGF